jgi:hypothetical protein
VLLYLTDSRTLAYSVEISVLDDESGSEGAAAQNEHYSLRPKSTVRDGGPVGSRCLLPSFRLFPSQACERQHCFESTHLFYARTRQFACNRRVRRAVGVKLSDEGSFNLATVVWENEKDRRLVLSVPFGREDGRDEAGKANCNLAVEIGSISGVLKLKPGGE